MLSKRFVSGLVLGAAMLVSAAVPIAAQAHGRVYFGSSYTVNPGNSYYGHNHRYHRNYPPYTYHYPLSYSYGYYNGGYGYSVPAYRNSLTIIYRIY
ncbi:MAG: hypothetical protein ACREUY_10440 [Burkholderiales bacterium]